MIDKWSSSIEGLSSQQPKKKAGTSTATALHLRTSAPHGTEEGWQKGGEELSGLHLQVTTSGCRKRRGRVYKPPPHSWYTSPSSSHDCAESEFRRLSGAL